MPKTKTPKTETTYRLGSAPMINTPGLLRWAINGYKFPRDRKNLLRIFVEGFSGEGAPSRAIFDRLLKGEISYTVDEEKAVVFTA